MRQPEQTRPLVTKPLRPGDQLEPLEVTVSPEKMKTAAVLLQDPNPIHFDTAAVQALGLGEQTINQGPLNMGYVMNMLAQFSGSHDRLRNFKVRFLANVYAGQRLRATGVVTDLQQLSDDELQVTCAVELTVIGGAAVLSGTATVVVPRTQYHASIEG